MDETVKSSGRLEVSVSFGRFENDLLSWEKFSSFSPNKYLEEVENLSTPGSVAQKKAYFEAHYKKIAARKAELLEEDNSMGPTNQISSEQVVDDCVENSAGIDGQSNVCNDENSTEVVDDVTSFDEAREEEIEQEVREEDEVEAVVGGKSGRVEEEKEESNGNGVTVELSDREEPIVIKEVIAEKDFEETKGKAEKSNVIRKENPKLNGRNQAQKVKVTPTKKGSISAVAKKSIVSSTTKSPHVSAPRRLKPTSTSTPISTSRPSKKVNETPLPKGRNAIVGESKRATPTSLHMSLSLGPTNSSANIRKSLIMERMGDKDIVKRAFKSFQNHINELRSPSDAKVSTSKEVSSTAVEQKVSSSFTPQKENDRLRKAAEKTVIQNGRLGTRSMSEYSALHKDRKNATCISHSIGLRNDEKAEKRKEFLKNLEAKSIARGAQDKQLSAKTKEEKDVEIRKTRQNVNLKATPTSSFSRGQAKGHSRKEGVDNKIHPRPTSSR